MRILLCAAILMLAMHPAFAQGDGNLDATASITPSPDAKLDSKNLHDQVSALIDDLAEADQNHFMALYHTHNLIGVVKTVRHDVEQAIKACSNAHPTKESKLNKRWKSWTGAVDPVLDEANGQVNNMIIVQSYAAPQDITAILNQANILRAKGDAAFVKVPVTSDEGCEKLYQTMRSTKDSMRNMLQDALINMPKLIAKKRSDTQSENADETAPKAE